MGNLEKKISSLDRAVSSKQEVIEHLQGTVFKFKFLLFYCNISLIRDSMSPAFLVRILAV